MRLIKRADVPVVPVYFDGENSLSFHLLGKLHPMLRTLRIPAEFLKKQKSEIRLGIGDRIEASELAALSEEEVRDLLHERTYSMRTS